MIDDQRVWDEALAGAKQEHPQKPGEEHIPAGMDLADRFDEKHPRWYEREREMLEAAKGLDLTNMSGEEILEATYQQVTKGLKPPTEAQKEDAWSRAFRLAQQGIESQR